MNQWGHTIGVDIIDAEIGTARLREITLLLTALSSYRIFVSGNSQRWFMPLGVEHELGKIQWGQEFYFLHGFRYIIDGFTPASEPYLALEQPSTYYGKLGRAIDETLSFPASLPSLLDSYFELPEMTRRVFLSCCSLFEQGLSLWQPAPSLSFAALVSALEALINEDHKEHPPGKCETCGQARYKLTQKFRDFFLRYGENTKEFKEFALKIYKYRSKILHTGALFLGEIQPVPFASGDSLDDDELRRNVVRTCRVCIHNWLISRYRNADTEWGSGDTLGDER